MAHEGIFATSDEILTKAGENVDGTGSTEARINALCVQVEATINNISRYDWSTNFALYKTLATGILTEVESNLVAIYLIQFNMSGYTTRIEAEDMINTLRDAALRGMSLLRDQEVVNWMKDQTV